MNRMEALRQKMAKEEIDALVISSEVNQSYICGLDYTDGYVLVENLIFTLIKLGVEKSQFYK